MELRHLRYFVAVAEEMNFGRAARRLRMSQPPLSQQVRDLEREIGVPLIDRSRRRIRLTHAGGLFLEEARRTLDQVERAARTAVRAHRGEVGMLSMGFVGSATYDLLPRVMRRFRERYPEVGLELQTMSTRQQGEAFREGRIQVGFLRPPVDAFLSTRTVLRERLVAALPADHPLAGQEGRVSLSELAAENFILWPRTFDPRVRDRIVVLCQRAGYSPHIVQESAELQTIAGLVAAWMGVSLLPGLPEYLLRHSGVVYRAVDEGGDWDLDVAWREDETSPVVRAFLEVVHLTIGDPDQGLPTG